MNLKTVVAAMLVTAGALGAGAAQARPDVDLVVRIGVPLPLPPLPPLPGIVIRPAPAPVVVQAPVYSQPVYQPAPVYVERDWRDRDDRREWRDHGRHDRDGDREWRHHPTRWDVDGDGVPNQHDRRPYDPRRF
ncbi:MAG: hypothetical protein U1F50_14470 [Rubrivivax sp.]